MKGYVNDGSGCMGGAEAGVGGVWESGPMGGAVGVRAWAGDAEGKLTQRQV